jgi:hypothetical protein
VLQEGLDRREGGIAVPRALPPVLVSYAEGPDRQLGILYLKGVVAGLLVIGALVAVNVAVPLGASLGRLSLSIVILLGAWGVALAVPLLLRSPSLWPSAAAATLAAPVLAVAAIVALWTDADRASAHVIGAAFAVLLYAFAAAPTTGLVLKGRAPLAWMTLAGLASAGLVVTAWAAGVEVDGRLLDSALRASLALLLASFVLLAPVWRHQAPRFLGWLAFAQFALVHAVDPWVGGGLSERLVMAGVLLLLVLGLAGVTLALIPSQPTPRPPPASTLRPKDKVG